MPSGILSPFFINPLISVLPRIFIGIVLFYNYKFIKRISKNTSIASLFAGVMGTITNTVFAMGMLYIVYAKGIVMAAGKSFKVILLGILFSSSIVEAIIMGIATFAIMQVYIKKKSDLAVEV